MALSPEQRTLRARKAALAAHAKHGSYNMTKKARAAFEDRFLDEVDPDRVLPAAERERRAEQAKSAHFAGLALKSSLARSERSKGRS